VIEDLHAANLTGEEIGEVRGGAIAAGDRARPRTIGSRLPGPPDVAPRPPAYGLVASWTPLRYSFMPPVPKVKVT
jgi:hypothetical protein